MEAAKDFDLGFPYTELVLVLLIAGNIYLYVIKDRNDFLVKNLILRITLGLVIIIDTIVEKIFEFPIIESFLNIDFTSLFLKMLLINSNKFILIAIFIIANSLIVFKKLKDFSSDE